ncbi:hypothetical protein AB0G32_32520 [Streptomyces sp. NPDC023723]|uniref:hypothetical protein n=1 Tax=Streptomyces sp. NPDC023723 TaxID=3154323 RepID=UPI0033D26958
MISARGCGCGPGGRPNDSKDYLVPTVPLELAMAPDVPAMTEPVPLHQTSLASAHENRPAG